MKKRIISLLLVFVMILGILPAGSLPAFAASSEEEALGEVDIFNGDHEIGYRDREGNEITDFISIKVRGPLAERCAAFAYKGCKLAASGDFETIVFSEDPSRQPGFLIKASEVEFLSPRRVDEGAAALPEKETLDDAA